MGYERDPRANDPRRDYYGRREPQDYGRDYGSGSEYRYSSARDYAAASDGDGQGRNDHGRGRGGRAYDDHRDRDGGYARDRGYGAYQQQTGYRGSYASDGHRFADADRDDRYGHRRDDGFGSMRQDHGHRQHHPSDHGRQPDGYDYQDRGFITRAGDEVRSWFGDEDAERRREADMRYDNQAYREDRDADYGSWRNRQIDALDRDYDEYRRENRSKFESEFATWRTNRQTQRDSLGRVEEHMDVTGSDGAHVGTVDKVRGDRILLTKNDADADGRHHSIPSTWIASVDTGVTLSKSADEAKRHWRDEERSQALFGYGDRDSARQADRGGSQGGGNLNRSFSGTY